MAVKKAEFNINILFGIALLAVVMLILVVVNTSKLTKTQESLTQIGAQQKEYIYCYTYCMAQITPGATCEINNKKIMCESIRKAYTSVFNYKSVIKIDSLAEIGIKKENLYDPASSSNNACKIYDFPKAPIDTKSLEKALQETNKNYKQTIEEVISKYKEIDYCLIATTIAVESSGGKALYNAQGASYGIVMLQENNVYKYGICKEGDNVCLQKLKSDPKFKAKEQIEAAAKYFKESFEKIAALKVPSENKKILDDHSILNLAYLAARYNGGDDALLPSNDCSLESCQNLKSDPYISQGYYVPKVLCASNPGGLEETQHHIAKFYYTYQLCKTTYG